MPAKTIQQQPVSMSHVSRVIFLPVPGGIDATTDYTPVDETGTRIGETRSFVEHFVGPDATRVLDWLGTEVLSDINAKEGT